MKMEKNKFLLDTLCLSTEDVDKSNLLDGSTKYLVDTKVLYVLYNNEWYEV